MKKLFTILLCFALSNNLLSQQDAMYTHYSFNTLAVNPAYAGSRDALTITGLHRSQWVSFPGAPVTNTITAHTPIFNDKIGLGVSLLSDKIGPIRNSSLFIDLAYKLELGTGQLAFGLKGGLGLMASQLGDLTIEQANDPNFSSNIQSQLLPNFGFGLYYHLPKFYVGLSTPKLLENNFKTSTTSGGTSLSSEERHYFLIAGSIFDISKSYHLKLKPTTFIKLTGGAPVELDVTALVYYKDFLWAGPMFRTGDAFGLLAGVNITQQFSLGYSFDWSYGLQTGRYNAGSHEIMLRYDFILGNQSKILSPRYF